MLATQRRMFGWTHYALPLQRFVLRAPFAWISLVCMHIHVCFRSQSRHEAARLRRTKRTAFQLKLDQLFEISESRNHLNLSCFLSATFDEQKNLFSRAHSRFFCGTFSFRSNDSVQSKEFYGKLYFLFNKITSNHQVVVCSTQPPRFRRTIHLRSSS